MDPSRIELNGKDLGVDQVAQVADGALVSISGNPNVRARVQASRDFIIKAVAEGRSIYGVTTKFGSLAGTGIPAEDAAELQNNLLWVIKGGAGDRIPEADVRATMAIHLNTLLNGVSGIRMELLERLALFINQRVCPHVYELGSIGASGDLVPLAAIAGALSGADPAFRVDFAGKTTELREMESQLGIAPLPLEAKEALALVNGTSASAGIACNVLAQAQQLFERNLGVHALMIQALNGSAQSFDTFIHEQKPHPGQLEVAGRIRELLDGSKALSTDDHRQDRYSIRCLPQFLGPVAEALAAIARSLEIEINAVSDNPLVDADHDTCYHGGNFLGQYIAEGMDRLRHQLGLMAKHLDSQIALLVEPAYSNGLPASLIGNPDRPVNMGLKGLQVSANSIVPQLNFYGQPIADRFPTHAEQFNQNINSQSYTAANLARKSVELYRNHLAIALMFAVQAVDLRCHAMYGHYDGREILSWGSCALYEKVLEALGRTPGPDRPYVWNDDEQALDDHIRMLQNM